MSLTRAYGGGASGGGGGGPASDVNVLNFPATQSIDDGGSSITIDGTVAISNFPASQAVETAYAVDDAAGGTDDVWPAGAVRDDALSTLTPAEGDYVNLRVDSEGALWVRPSGTVTVDGAVSVSNLPAVQSIDDNGGSITVDGTVAATQAGAWNVTVQEPLTVDDGGGSITVDGSLSVSNFPASQTVDGTVAVSSIAADVEVVQATHDDLNCNANVQQGNSDVAAGNALYVRPGTGATFDVDINADSSLDAQGAAAVDAEPGRQVLFRRDDSPSAPTGVVDGDLVIPSTDANGVLWVRNRMAEQILSGSTNGQVIAIAATGAGSPTTIHQVPAVSGTRHKVTLWASNRTDTAVLLTVQTAAGVDEEITIGGRDKVFIGIHVLESSGSAVTLSAFAGTSNAIGVNGHYEEIA